MLPAVATPCQTLGAALRIIVPCRRFSPSLPSASQCALCATHYLAGLYDSVTTAHTERRKVGGGCCPAVPAAQQLQQACMLCAHLLSTA